MYRDVLLDVSPGRKSTGYGHVRSVFQERYARLSRRVKLVHAAPRYRMSVGSARSPSGSAQDVWNRVVSDVAQTSTQAVRMTQEQLGKISLTADVQTAIHVELVKSDRQFFSTRQYIFFFF